jgi:sulfate adenylyltransferase subunit 1
VTLTLAEDLDASRGDMITGVDDAPEPRTQVEAMICWMSPKPMKKGAKYRLRHTTRLVKAVVSGIEYRVDPNTLEKQPAAELHQNDIARIGLKTLLPIACDPYRENRETGAFLLIDDNNDTAAAGFIEL